VAPQQGVLLKSSIVRVSKGGFVKTLVAVPLNNEEMQETIQIAKRIRNTTSLCGTNSVPHGGT